MPSAINCPSCERRLNVPPALVGEHVQCPTCGETFTADLDNPPPPPPVDDDLPERGIPLLPDEDEAPRRRPPARRDEDDEPDDYRPRRRRRPDRDKPGNLTTLGVLMLVGGIFGILLFAGLSVGTTFMCCLWPGTYYSLVMGILVTIKGAELLGNRVPRMAPPRWAAVLMIVNVVSFDLVNLALGIVCLVLLNDEEVVDYLRR